MENCNIKNYRMLILCGISLICLGMVFPFITRASWFQIISKIKEAINAGDSGHLILASASMSFMYSIQSTFLFIGAELVINNAGIKQKTGKLNTFFISLSAIILLHMADSKVSDLPWEPVSTITAIIISFIIAEKLFGTTSKLIHVLIVSLQVFFAFQWLNIMPMFSPYQIGQSDIPSSIKIAGMYLQASSVLNFMGFAFFLPFLFSSFITATLFISYAQNIDIMKENYEKERELQSMKSKILENRIYMEVKSLVHDLKTPLVTIHGLNSLLAVSKDQGKLEEYSQRIDNSVSKMSDMISSFLYETSRQRLPAADLISYIRAQLPLEDDSIKIDIIIANELPDIFVNKIRIARAVINIMENAIVVPCKNAYKHIIFEVKPVVRGISIIIRDNGIGIKESELSRIWEVGYSTNNTSGLGLPFARQIIEGNEGTIEIFSRYGEGTTVIICLPSFCSISERK